MQKNNGRKRPTDTRGNDMTAPLEQQPVQIAKPSPPMPAPEPMPAMMENFSGLYDKIPAEGMANDPPTPGIRVGGPGGVLDAMEVKPIGKEQILEAQLILNKYRAGKARFDRRIVECEQWWKLRHWDYMTDAGNPEDDKTKSAWLFNCVMSKHADAIEGYPEPNIRPREKNDKEEAKRLSAIVPVILEQNDYETTYSEEKWQKLKQGTGITGVFWDKTKLNGLGDVSIRKMDALNIFWEPGITDIQRSRHIFTTELVDIDLLKEEYHSVLAGESVTGRGVTVNKYQYDDNVDTSNKAMVVDWYYHKIQGGKKVLHYVKFVDEHVLFATENEPTLRERGLYDHGLFPFVFDPLFPIEGSPCGYGYIDVGKNPQMTIDRMNQALEKNMLMSSHPRFFIRTGSSVNEEEFADWTKPFVHTTSPSLGEDSIRQVQVSPLSSLYAQIQQSKIEELKETTGNRDASNGGTTSGVTAASAIAAMQEQAGKTSRASTRASYRAYARMVNMVIELIRQFYDLPRQYRITGENGQEEFVQYDNSHLKPQQQYDVMGNDMGMRLPVFDVEVSAQKMTAYTKIAQNEMALQMFQLGVLDPANSDRALTLLDIMDFNGKSLIEDKIRQNGTMYQELAYYKMISLELAQQTGRADIVEALASDMMSQQTGAGGMQQGNASAEFANGHAADNVTGLKAEEHPFVEKARKENQDSTQVT